LFIVVFHYFCVFYGADASKISYSEVIRNLFQYSQYCVELFFMLSGFLMAYNYKEKIQEYGIIEFVKKKIESLILPLIIANVWSLINNILVQVLVQKTTQITVNIWNLLISIVPIHNGWIESQKIIGLPTNGTMWFIDVLILCYIIYYIIGRFTRSNDLYMIWCLIMTCLGYACITYNWEMPFLYYEDGRGYAPFFFGTLLYEIYSRTKEKIGRSLAIGLLIFSICGLIIRICVGLENAYGDFYKYFIFVLCPTFIMSALYVEPIKRWLSMKAFIYLGTISMGVYFVHDALFRSINLLNTLGGNCIEFRNIIWLPAFLLVAVVGGMTLNMILKTRVLNDN